LKAAVERAQVERFRALISQRLGLQLDDTRLDELAEVLRRRVDASRSEAASPYLSRLAAAGDRDELRALARQLTIGETYFFRNTEQFEAFSDVVVAERARAQSERRQLRLLSAGCSSGEEAYSLAIWLRERWPQLASWDVRIVAVDVNPQVLERAAQARYPAWSFRETPAELRKRYFASDDGREFQLDPSLRANVSFEERNLLDDDPSFWQPGSFDVVFCRNVTMYFTPEVTAALIARFAVCLAPGGYLFLGHAETLRGISQDFHLRHTHNTFYYQRREGSLHAPAGPSVEATLPRPSDSWIDVIRRASERIAALTQQKSGEAAPPAALPVRAPRWDRTLAMELFRQERFSEAIVLMRGLPADAIADADAQLLLAALLTNAGQLAEAERVCRALLESDEMNAGAHYLLALGREHAGDRAAAVEHDQTAVYLDAGFAMPRLHLGLLAKRAGDLETARRELALALTLLSREDGSRILFFGGGFTREALAELCRAELAACGGSDGR
jgi:chemotaxis protein methyltransferase CheR